MKKFLSSCCVLFSLCTLHATEDLTKSYTMIDNVIEYPVLSPMLSERQTAKVLLKNGIQAYLVFDPNAEQSAAAVCVGTGSWEDPEKYPGTAHFLEHMLFLGTKAYPNEAEYMKYIQDNGGSVNAFTASDKTVYMFSINNDAFTGAVDRFSHFFLDPLFSPSCINRELHAVDQEFSKNLENDFWRILMVLKETGRQDHPNAKFSIGNAATLSCIPQEVLQDWYQTHYKTDKMHVAMISPLPLEDMVQLLDQKFSLIPEKLSSETPSYGPSFSESQKGHFLYIKPIKDAKILSLMWELPSEYSAVEQKWASDLIAYALNDTSDQSFYQALKRQQLADQVSCYTIDASANNLLFCMTISLTDQGLPQVDTVISLLYQTLSRLKQSGIPLSLYEEMKTMAQIHYQYQSKENPFTWITDIAANLPNEDLSTFPEKLHIPGTFNPESLSQLIFSLTPESCIYVILADPEKLDVTLDKQEKWMQVPYLLEQIPSTKLSAWKTATPHPSIQLPSANPFLPTSLALLHPESRQDPSCIIPKQIIQDDKSSFYFAQDGKYLLPESAYLFTIKTPAINASVRSSVLCDLLTRALYDTLAPTLFFAEHAGLSCNFYTKNFGFSVHIAGYSEKADFLTETVFATLKNISCSEESFMLYKEALLSSYTNEASEIPMTQALMTAYNILLSDVQIGSEKKQALEQISFNDFTDFCNTWLNTVYLEGMFYGNITEDSSIKLATAIKEQFTSSPAYEKRQKQSLLLLPPNQGPFKVSKQTERQGNGTVLAIEEGPFSFAKKASQSILSSALQEAFFDTLRTKQQTAYLVRSWDLVVDEQLLQMFAVQSSSHLPEDLLYRFELFLEDCYKRLPEFITKEQFNTLKNTEIVAEKIAPTTIYEMAKKLSVLAFLYEGDFTRSEKQIKAYESLAYEDFLLDAETFIGKRNKKRLAILMKGEQSIEKPLQYAEIAKEDILKTVLEPIQQLK